MRGRSLTAMTSLGSLMKANSEAPPKPEGPEQESVMMKNKTQRDMCLSNLRAYERFMMMMKMVMMMMMNHER